MIVHATLDEILSTVCNMLRGPIIYTNTKLLSYTTTKFALCMLALRNKKNGEMRGK